jgi:hypothetical protein
LRDYHGYVDILPAINGEDSYSLSVYFPEGFGGFLPQPPYFGGGQRGGFTLGLSSPRSFMTQRSIDQLEEKKKEGPYIPGLKSEALRPTW